jgi:predicted nucleic acid-binding protein
LGLGLHQIPAKLADLQIGGIAAAYGLSLATRNVADFRGSGLELINPWEPGPV